MNKKILNKVIIAILTIILFTSFNVYAASINGNSNVYVGDTVTVTFNFGQNVGAYDDITVGYDSHVLEYVSGDSLKELAWYDATNEQYGISTKTYTFKAVNEGSGRISVTVNGAVSANDAMDPIGTIAAEKIINVSKKAETPVEKPTTTTPSQGNVNTGSQTASGNNYLKYLQISEEGLTPYFTRNITDYAITVGENVNDIEILAKAEDENARVEISGNNNLKEGNNEINIKVTAENGYYRIYTIIVTKVQDKSKADAFLGSLVIEGYNLNKEFQAEALEYNIGEILSTIKSLNIVAEAKDKDAKVEIIGADKLVESGDGQIIIKVTAPDGITVKEYKVKYSVKEATEDEVSKQDMKDHLKQIHESQGKKELVLSYLKYIWAAIKKNYLLVIMYILVLAEFINIVLLRRKINKMENNNNDPDDNNPTDKTILKFEKDNEKEELPDNIQAMQEHVKIEPPKVELLDEPVINNKTRIGRTGSVRADSVETIGNTQPEQSGIKLVDLDKNDGPKDELTFNIFENLTDEDIKQMLDDQIDKE